MQPKDGTISSFWDGVSKPRKHFVVNTMTATMVFVCRYRQYMLGHINCVLYIVLLCTIVLVVAGLPIPVVAISTGIQHMEYGNDQ